MEGQRASVGDVQVTLADITEIMGRHYTQSLKDGGDNPERVLRLFTDRVVEDLKKLPPRRAQKSAN